MAGSDKGELGEEVVDDFADAEEAFAAGAPLLGRFAQLGELLSAHRLARPPLQKKRKS